MTEIDCGYYRNAGYIKMRSVLVCLSDVLIYSNHEPRGEALVVQYTLQHTFQQTLQHTQSPSLKENPLAVQYTLQCTEKYTLQNTLQNTLQHMQSLSLQERLVLGTTNSIMLDYFHMNESYLIWMSHLSYE